MAIYKILRNGQSCSGGTLAWSLPDGDTPGGWHEVSGKLVQCRNGLHLTDDLTRWSRLGGDYQIYLAEHEGETAGPFGDELVCRKVRLLRRIENPELAEILAELAATADARRAAAEAAENERNRIEAEKRRAENREWRSRKKAADESKESPAYALLTHVWRETDGGSWERLNNAMSSSLRLAICSGMRFNPDDFSRFSADFRSGRWIGDGEYYYALACGRDRDAHGGNPSAVRAYETYRGRKPFLVLKEAGGFHYGSRKGDGPKARLCVGETFAWHVDLKSRVQVRVTSFLDKPPGDKPPYVVACSYKTSETGGSERKIDRRFAITHDAIAEYHKAVKDAVKRRSALVGAPAS